MIFIRGSQCLDYVLTLNDKPAAPSMPLSIQTLNLDIGSVLWTIEPLNAIEYTCEPRVDPVALNWLFGRSMPYLLPCARRVLTGEAPY
jgi:hypothetical protein